MNVQTIEMDPQEARERLKAYRSALHRRVDEEYQAAAAGYQALAEGTPLLQYGPAIRETIRDDKGRPMLAVARADRRQVELRWRGTGAEYHTCPRHRCYDQLHLTADMRARPLERWGVSGYALVPMVPPAALATIGGATNLRDYLILWEVEEWSDRRIGAMPDRDPYLLRPIHGDLCAVVAEWDLTNLERAVMAGRASR